MGKEVTVVIQGLFWQREALKISFQYFCMALLAIPTGILFYVLLRFNLAQLSALIIALSVGAIASFFIWSALDKYLGQFEIFQPPIEVVATYTQIDTSFPLATAGALCAVALIATASNPSPEYVTLPDAPNSISSTYEVVKVNAPGI